MKVKKGEKGTRIQRVVVLDGETNTADKDKKVLKFYTVFNIDQCEPLTINNTKIEIVPEPLQVREKQVINFEHKL